MSASNYGKITRGLIIRDPWISMILEGWKTWEMRTKPTSIRGPIALIRGGSGAVVGVANLVDSKAPLSEAEMQSSELLHGIGGDRISQVVANGWVVPWVLEDTVAIAPVPYSHPNGAVTWVTLAPEVTQAIASRFGQHSPAITAPPSVLPTPPKVAADDAVMIPITGGNLRNGHIHLRHVPEGFFPAAVFGGSNKAVAARHTIRVTYEPGPTVETDIASDKHLFRDRTGLRAFFEASGAREGDKAGIERRLDGSYLVRLVRS